MIDKQYGTAVYDLEKSYKGASYHAKLPPRRKPREKGLNRYVEKVKRCGRGTMRGLHKFCECRQCATVRAGESCGGGDFVQGLIMQRLMDCMMQDQRDEDTCCGEEPLEIDYLY